MSSNWSPGFVTVGMPIESKHSKCLGSVVPLAMFSIFSHSDNELPILKKSKAHYKKAKLNSTQQKCEIILISKRHDKKGHIFTVFNSITQ